MREGWIDRWKGLLILLVVLGHAAGGGGKLSQGEVSQWLMWVRSVIYQFHMPAFFLLAGLCYKPFSVTCADVNNIKGVLQKRVERLIVPYLSFGLLSWVVYDAMFCSWGDFFSQMGRLLIAYDEFRCNSVLWFLPTMFGVLLLALIGDILIKKHWQMVIAVLVVSAGFFFLRYNHITKLPFEFFKVMNYYPYFMVGRAFRVFRKAPIGARHFPLIMLMSFCYIAFCKYTDFDTRPFRGFLLWMFMGLGGAVLSAAVVKTMPGRFFTWLEWVGRASLGIMLVHKFPLIFVQEHVMTRIDLLNPKTDCLWGATLSVILVTISSAMISCLTIILIRWRIPWIIGESRRS